MVVVDRKDDRLTRKKGWKCEMIQKAKMKVAMVQSNDQGSDFSNTASTIVADRNSHITYHFTEE